LATGLAGDDAPLLYDRLLGPLGAGRSLRDVAALQREPVRDPAAPGAAAGALFTDLPWLCPKPR
jgi:hypothetical protein